jgi:predicted ATP-grasp superfamily ATP-dependent carboligase
MNTWPVSDPSSHEPHHIDADEPPGGLILGGAHGSLAVARSLGRRGIPACYVFHGENPVTQYSRYVEKVFRWDGPASANAAEFLIDLAGKNGLEGWVLFAGGDAEANLIARNKEALAKVFRVLSAPFDTVQTVQDKNRMYRQADALGLYHPWNYYPDDPASRDELRQHFPIVIKPSGEKGDDELSRSKAWLANNEAEFAVLYAKAIDIAGKQGLVVQERIPGGGEQQFSYAGVWKEGVPTASFVARRTRQYPVHFGFTSTCVEVMSNPEVEEAAGTFLRSIDFSGLVEVEFKYDARDGHYKILDINPRTWTWIGIGAVSGIDMPWICWQVAMDRHIEHADAVVGVAWRHFSRDAVAMLQGMAPVSAWWANIKARAAGKVTFAAFAWDDMLPGIMDLPLLFPRVNRRIAQRIKFHSSGMKRQPEAIGDDPS